MTLIWFVIMQTDMGLNRIPLAKQIKLKLGFVTKFNHNKGLIDFFKNIALTIRYLAYQV